MPEPDDEDPQADEPDRDFPVQTQDRFSIKGRELSFADFVAETMRGVAEREPLDAQPQPAAQPFELIWGARRPADWIEPEE